MNILKRLFKKYTDSFAFKKHGVTDADLQNKITYLGVFLLMGTVLGFLYSIYNIINGNFPLLLNSICVFSVSILLLLVLYYKLKPTIISVLLTTLLSISFIYLLFVGEENDMLWFFIIPALNLFLLGINAGIIYSIVFLAIVGVLLFFNEFMATITVSYDFKLKFVFSYLSVFFISFIYEFVRKQTRKRLVDSLENIKKINEKNKAKADFLVQLSHQIRTPLSSIVGITNIIKETNLSKEQLDLIEALITSANSLEHVVNSITEYSDKTTEGNIKQDSLNIDLEALISDSIIQIKNEFKKNEISATVSVFSNVPNKLIGNPDRIMLLLGVFYNNIIKNAKRNTIDIIVNAKTVSDKVDSLELLFEVSSSSLKLSRDIPENFDKSYDYSIKQDKVELNVKRKNINKRDDFEVFDFAEAKKIIEGYGCKLGYQVKDGTEITFWFTINLWKPEANQVRYEKIKNDSEYIQPIRIKKKLIDSSVLIVEDNIMNQKVISLALKDKVKDIFIANNGKEAIKIFANSKVDIILMDLQMPILDGYKTTAKIKELEVGTDINTPIIALTANAMQGEEEKCLAIGMNDYLTKPFQIENLLEKMEFQLSK
ncbi:MAG: response regulator [Bacteroidales bacterium]|nr:response regulator [Bacteroidales bacterium]